MGAFGSRASQRGFTLLEMLVALGLIAICLAFATPYFRGMMENSRVRTTAQSIFSAFQKARSEAVRLNSDVVISFVKTAEGTTGGYEVFLDDGAGTGTAGNLSRDGSEGSFTGVVTVEQGVDLYEADFDGNTATGFTSRGLPLDGRSGQVAVKNDRGRNLTIVLSPAGAVRIR
ncbi:type IV pilin [Desulfuromonas versatilis]|uniref:Type II secretion system protein H n=1 Tax=Desulfuromonas versatilis TaxID=2802975 RepID=A0ABN6E431_9BACT|nr:GspH/FimT family pseudopilin [Desulfuromonas versatilis]BCR07007.1 type IV pilin [Desulfuromonas versatilis]